MADGRYTKALDNIKALRKERNIELKLDRERLGHFKADKDKAERVSCLPMFLKTLAHEQMRKQLNDETAKENAKATEAEELKIEVERLKAVNMEYYAQAATFQQQYDREKSLKEQLEMRKDNMTNMLGDTPQMTGELASGDRIAKLIIRNDGRTERSVEQFRHSYQVAQG